MLWWGGFLHSNFYRYDKNVLFKENINYISVKFKKGVLLPE